MNIQEHTERKREGRASQHNYMNTNTTGVHEKRFFKVGGELEKRNKRRAEQLAYAK